MVATIKAKTNGAASKFGFMDKPALNPKDFFNKTINNLPLDRLPYYYSPKLGTYSVTSLIHAGEKLRRRFKGNLPGINIPYCAQKDLKEKLKTLFELEKSNSFCFQFVRHLDVLLKPELLKEWDIDYTIIEQSAG
ncbi:hypothetical protein BU16DRAFT_545213 [Lophium mytilinum]|uniref:Uncharacterized protein n=1 Tax=Lophium mytilinum TaxID=390894 RepID=A0A6A6Q9K1_9PEZI|nr:hypothetical protein BU16DRAFT_545213 [Lophium mytilinum]